MKITAEKYREARKKYLASLSPEEREQIEETKRKAEADARKRWAEFRKLINQNLEANGHHEKAIGILKEAIQSAAKEPSMTLEIKELAETFILLIEERSMFEYDSDRFFDPIIKIDRSESGKKAAEKRHAENYKLHEKVRSAWASGKYSSRDICAEEEYSLLGFGSFKAARNALKGTPDPLLWPAAKKSKK
jgi:hypothetical protein